VVLHMLQGLVQHGTSLKFMLHKPSTMGGNILKGDIF